MFIKVIEDLARKEGKYKAVEVKRECGYMEDLAQQKLEEATAAAVKAAEKSKRRAMEAQQAVASWANVPRPPGLSELEGEEEDTPLVGGHRGAKECVWEHPQ